MTLPLALHPADTPKVRAQRWLDWAYECGRAQREARANERLLAETAPESQYSRDVTPQWPKADPAWWSPAYAKHTAWTKDILEDVVWTYTLGAEQSLWELAPFSWYVHAIEHLAPKERVLALNRMDCIHSKSGMYGRMSSEDKMAWVHIIDETLAEESNHPTGSVLEPSSVWIKGLLNTRIRLWLIHHFPSLPATQRPLPALSYIHALDDVSRDVMTTRAWAPGGEWAPERMFVWKIVSDLYPCAVAQELAQHYLLCNTPMHPRAGESDMHPEAVAWIERAQARHQAWSGKKFLNADKYPKEYHVFCLRQSMECSQPVLSSGELAAYHLMAMDSAQAWWEMMDRQGGVLEGDSQAWQLVESGDFTP